MRNPNRSPSAGERTQRVGYAQGMLWGMFGRRRLMLRGQRYRTEHSMWLTEAVHGRCRFVRIPTKPVSSGGFGPMTSRPDGEGARWWAEAFEKTDPD